MSAMQRPVGKVERVGPIPELKVARDEGAARSRR